MFANNSVLDIIPLEGGGVGDTWPHILSEQDTE